METIRDQVIEREHLCLDDKNFSDCTLIECVLEYSGRPFILERTRLQGCNYVFLGSARGTVHLLQTVGLLSHQPNEWAEIPEFIRSEGSL